MCSKRKFIFGVDKSKCMIIGCLCNEESLNVLSNVFNSGGNNASHVTKQTDSHFVGLVMPACYTQEPLLVFRRIFIRAYVNPRQHTG